ncbi:MAG: methyltransferase domain-containing protein [Euryarchaeota archaeon]|nr:methyltransferase domain-containing protein [Euryarchaeota archaeon]
MKGKEWYQADDVAEEYDDKRFSEGGAFIDRREKEAVLSALGPVEGQRILEVACGTGRFTVMMAQQGADIIGLDISPAMLSQGRQKAKEVGVDDHVEFMRGDAARLPFPDDHFDAVFAMRFFHLADRPVTFLRELRRVSKGEVFFDTFNLGSTRVIYNWLLPMGSRLYSRRDVESLLADSGLELRSESHDFILPYGLYRQLPREIARPLRRLDTGLGTSPVGDRLASVSYWHTTK